MTVSSRQPPANRPPRSSTRSETSDVFPALRLVVPLRILLTLGLCHQITTRGQEPRKKRKKKKKEKKMIIIIKKRVEGGQDKSLKIDNSFKPKSRVFVPLLEKINKSTNLSFYLSNNSH